MSSVNIHDIATVTQVSVVGKGHLRLRHVPILPQATHAGEGTIIGMSGT